MANDLYTPEQAARATLARLRYLSVLPRTVRQDFSTEFVAGRGQTVNVKGPVTVAEARTYTKVNRTARDAIVFDDLAQTTYPVKMEDQVYSGVRLPDDFATFTLEDMNRQVLAPQADSVIRGITDPLHATMQKVATDSRVPLMATDGSNAVAVITKLRRILNSREVPMMGRYLAIGPGLEEIIGNVESLQKVNEAGDSSLLREGIIGRLKGFTVVVEPRLPAYFGSAYMSDAFAHVTRPSRLPEGAPNSAIAARDGLSMRWLRHYNPSQLEDQSVVDAFVGSDVLDAGRALTFGAKLVGSNINVTPETASIAVGATTTLVVTDDDGEVIPNRLIAFTTATARQTVSADGVVTGVSAGAASNVTATFDGQSDTAAITVTS